MEKPIRYDLTGVNYVDPDLIGIFPTDYIGEIANAQTRTVYLVLHGSDQPSEKIKANHARCAAKIIELEADGWMVKTITCYSNLSPEGLVRDRAIFLTNEPMELVGETMSPRKMFELGRQGIYPMTNMEYWVEGFPLP